jgi:hypothetical protein
VIEAYDPNLSRFWDATALAEYLFERINDAVHSLE